MMSYDNEPEEIEKPKKKKGGVDAIFREVRIPNYILSGRGGAILIKDGKGKDYSSEKEAKKKPVEDDPNVQ